MFKVGLISAGCKIMSMLFGRVLLLWFCVHAFNVYVFLQQFVRRFRICISFLVLNHWKARIEYSNELLLHCFFFIKVDLQNSPRMPQNFFSHISSLVYVISPNSIICYYNVLPWATTY